MPDSLKNKNVWLYWKAVAYQQLDKDKLAAIIWQRIPDDGSYYALLAKSQLKAPAVYSWYSPDNTTFTDDDFATQASLALELYRLGKQHQRRSLINIGFAMWKYIVKNTDDEMRLAMSNRATNAGFYDMSIYAANALSTHYANLSFPTPFLPIYTKYSKDYALPVTFPLAITRQESRFNYSVVATDGGQGLMQIMPDTQRYIMQQSKAKRCAILTPLCNIRYGTWYLSANYAKLGSFLYTAAAYNAGPGRAKTWQSNLSGLDIQSQIELIPFDITRNYVQQVMLNKAVYDNHQTQTSQLNLLSYINKLK
jgi:soluble lytic murein transglycosylase